MSVAYAKRFEAVFLCSHPKGPKMSYAATAKYIKKSVAFVQKWNTHYAVHKNVNDSANRGKAKATTKRQDLAIQRIFIENKKNYNKKRPKKNCRKREYTYP